MLLPIKIYIGSPEKDVKYKNFNPFLLCTLLFFYCLLGSGNPGILNIDIHIDCIHQRTTTFCGLSGV
jgi:hypothetical protein